MWFAQTILHTRVQLVVRLRVRCARRQLRHPTAFYCVLLVWLHGMFGLRRRIVGGHVCHRRYATGLLTIAACALKRDGCG